MGQCLLDGEEKLELDAEQGLCGMRSLFRLQLAVESEFAWLGLG
jgi:hypothetical protein